MLLLAMTAVGVCEDHGHRIFLPVARESSAGGAALLWIVDLWLRENCNRNSMFGVW